MSVQAAVVIAVAVLIGAALQRLSGMGLALVAAPVLAIVVGPVAGIFVMNVVGLVSSILVMLSVLADVEWRRFFLMLPGILVGAAMGALVVREVPASWLQILIGAVVLIGLATTFGVPGLPLLTSRFLTPAAGAASGFVSATAGVSSPPMVIYAKLAGWDQRPFAGTMQPIFITTALSAVVTKIVLDAVPFSQMPSWWIFPLMIAVVLAGIELGRILRRRVSARTARNVAITIATLGSLAAVIRGIIAL